MRAVGEVLIHERKLTTFQYHSKRTNISYRNYFAVSFIHCRKFFAVLIICCTKMFAKFIFVALNTYENLLTMKISRFTVHCNKTQMQNADMHTRKHQLLYSGNLLQVKTFTNFVVSGEFAKVLIAKIFIEYRGVTINGRVIILHNDNSVGVMDVASLLLVRQYLPNSSLIPKPPRRHGSLNK